ncbi:uncharacterized protein LOC108043168 isoform X2 [Drosophila rhopaloa]|uniref:Uncharacterized protein LOC108043168 isoform X2 n=1 Tax=Drosophila rhopaloa TaxID=1041015 RepID=A0A6P4EKW4_DRORH|nr:uncharacterized protein LOC108043168 isoform X2 [Drosophila rhopaloa]
MEQQENISIQDAESMDTQLALKNAGIENNRLKLEVSRLGEILEKQRKVLQEAEDRRKEAKLIFSALMTLKQDNGKFSRSTD